MTTRPSVDFRCLTITASDGTYDYGDPGRHLRYTVSVRSDSTNITRRFTFHDSIANYKNGRRGLAGDDLLDAFRCFVSDADMGSMPFAEFADDLGYDHDSYSARQIHKACRDARHKFNDLWHLPTEPTDVLEELAALGVE